MGVEHVIHTFEPVYDKNSKILVLGSFPSIKSRENGFYYGHPMNRFWKVQAGIFEETIPKTIEEKKTFLLMHNIAVWDVIASCDIEASSDSSIRNVIANDMDVILKHAPIEAIIANGGKAYELFLKYCKEQTKLIPKKMPSTSPANAAWSLEKLIETWKTALV